METHLEEPETRILEINLISAQGLKIPPSAMKRQMHTYALAWVDPNAKLRSDLDRVGGENPTWNDKFIFRVSHDFINGDTSAVQFQIYAVGYIRDYFVGTVRYLLSSSPVSSRSGAVIGTPGFSALHIRRPSGRVHGVLNIAATVYNSSDFASLTGVSAICFRDLIGKNNKTDNHLRERRLSRCLSHVRSRRSEQSTEPESKKIHQSTEIQSSDLSKRIEQSTNAKSCDVSCEESVYFSESDGTDSTMSSSSSSTTVTAFEDCNGVRSNYLEAGKRVWKLNGGSFSLLCSLIFQRKCSPSDQNLPSGKD